MRQLRRSLVILPLCLFAILPVRARDVAATVDAGQQALYFDPSILRPQVILPPYYPDESPQARDERREVVAATANATPEQLALATKDATTRDIGFFADTIAGFDLSRLPVVASLFDAVRHNGDYGARTIKTYFHRRRPYVVDATIRTCVPPEKGGDLASYPSGHSTMAYSMGVVLATLIPERAAEIMSRARLYADNRLICGAHHRSDIAAGQVVGTLLATEMLQNETFQERLRAAREELRRAGLTGP